MGEVLIQAWLKSIKKCTKVEFDNAKVCDEIETKQKEKI